MNIKEILSDIGKTVKDHVQKAIDALNIKLNERFHAIENKLSGFSESIAELKRFSDGGVLELSPEVERYLELQISNLPKPKDGEKGKDAEINPDELKSLINSAVEKALSDIKIPAPRNGEDGKDALELEILPEIDLEKSYCRGTYAIHNGGLWRSFERTKGLRGWEAVVKGLSNIEVEYDEERTVTIKLQTSTDEVISKSIIMPVPIYKEIYREGTQYNKSDCVTFGGSIYIALKDTSSKPGSGNGDWRLAVKAGRNANPKVKVGSGG